MAIFTKEISAGLGKEKKDDLKRTSAIQDTPLRITVHTEE
jgi:hypothetical protein